MTKKITDYQRKSNRQGYTRYVIILLLLITAAFDFITFANNPQYRIFDMSLLTVLFKSIYTIFLIKFAVVFLLCWLLYTHRKINDYLIFLYIMMSVYLILFQLVGGISNMMLQASEPSLESAPSIEQRTEIGISFAMVWAYYPICFAMLCFWLFRWGWGTNE